MIEDYLRRAKEILRTNDPRIIEVPFGRIIIGGNWTPNIPLKVYCAGLELDLTDRVLHQRVAYIERSMGIRSHEEESEEAIQNIGDTKITLVFPISREIVRQGDARYSIVRGDSKERRGFFHGFDVERPGLVYIAKALHPEFVDGDSFRVPKNTYQI